MTIVELLVWAQCCIDVETYLGRPMPSAAMQIVEGAFVEVLLIEDRWISNGLEADELPSPDLVRRAGVAAFLTPRAIMAMMRDTDGEA